MLLGNSRLVAWAAPAPISVFLPGLHYPEMEGLLPKPATWLLSDHVALFCRCYFLQELLKLETHRVAL